MTSTSSDRRDNNGTPWGTLCVIAVAIIAAIVIGTAVVENDHAPEIASAPTATAR